MLHLMQLDTLLIIDVNVLLLGDGDHTLVREKSAVSDSFPEREVEHLSFGLPIQDCDLTFLPCEEQELAVSSVIYPVRPCRQGQVENILLDVFL